MNRVEGRAWVFGDGVDTDVMFPGAALRLPLAEAAELAFSAIRPEWHREVAPGDVVVAGHRLGTGSARPVGDLLTHLGVAAVLAESMSSLFQRNCVNAGLVALSVPGVTELVSEGDVLSLSVEEGALTNLSSGRSVSFEPPPQVMVELVESGGVVEMLRRKGYLPPSSDGTPLPLPSPSSSGGRPDPKPAGGAVSQLPGGPP